MLKKYMFYLSIYILMYLSIIQSSLMSVCPSIRLKLKILVTTEPIGFKSSWNISTGPVVVLSYFVGGCDISNPYRKQNNTPIIFT